MENTKRNVLVIYGAKLVLRNFAGRQTKYTNGSRTFGVLIDPSTANKMAEEGWNIKYFQPKNEGEGPVPWINVAVNYNNIPPNIILISSGGKTRLSEDKIDMLDWAQLSNIDVSINPRKWVNDAGKTCIKAYLKSMYATVYEDELDIKYSEINGFNSCELDGCPF